MLMRDDGCAREEKQIYWNCWANSVNFGNGVYVVELGLVDLLESEGIWLKQNMS